eukprot:GHVN01101877.1.p1 GENE.GHVN01101877.1~~GHVN01101877.1.p1  ORF type:complete len:243 (-),score=25.68 GHVN01101877.1:63-752(-)
MEYHERIFWLNAADENMRSKSNDSDVKRNQGSEKSCLQYPSYIVLPLAVLQWRLKVSRWAWSSHAVSQRDSEREGPDDLIEAGTIIGVDPMEASLDGTGGLISLQELREVLAAADSLRRLLDIACPNFGAVNEVAFEPVSESRETVECQTSDETDETGTGFARFIILRLLLENEHLKRRREGAKKCLEFFSSIGLDETGSGICSAATCRGEPLPLGGWFGTQYCYRQQR